ncbi:Mitochondrial distribution/morphology family 35/apoptosis [Penicillium verrucosum]|uniref:Mitochondrial distribution/morphology family 35/apoptosis n=1 Tax=Penicillium verrucosum TaxID=60171 RepID=UPI002544ED2F|nr:Mitochondrial distribution/morphology family 35/apoptosis [Penicillium verrucosum]KAJ5943930.1 Mitochondrial distribution/morphology family 35/apoptosis [Penicillium verrucosum]
MAASIAPECNDIKEKYDTCFLKWYSEKYLRGNTSSNDCEALFKNYKGCLTKVLKERGIDAMVDDARKSGSSETDAEFLKKS